MTRKIGKLLSALFL